MHQNQVLAAKIETTYGTAISLANTDAGFRVIDRHFKVNGDTERRERQGGLGVDLNIGGITPSVEIDFTTHLAGKGATGDVPFWGTNFLQAAGFALSTSTFTGSADTSTWKSLTMAAYIDGRRYLASGCMLTGVLTLEAGKPGRIAWKAMGAYAQDPDDTAILTGMTYEAAIPPIWAGTGSLSLGSATTYTKLQKLTIDFGGELSMREDPNAANGSGYLGAWLGNRITKVTMDPEATAFATKNWWAAWRAGTEVALSAVVGTTTHNICTIAATLQGDVPDYGERNKKLVDNVGFDAVRDSLSLVFS